MGIFARIGKVKVYTVKGGIKASIGKAAKKSKRK